MRHLMPVVLGCSFGAHGAVTETQPVCVAAEPRVWWPRDAEETLDSSGLRLSQVKD